MRYVLDASGSAGYLFVIRALVILPNFNFTCDRRHTLLAALAAKGASKAPMMKHIITSFFHGLSLIFREKKINNISIFKQDLFSGAHSTK
jgi:hypothetical protein